MISTANHTPKSSTGTATSVPTPLPTTYPRHPQRNMRTSTRTTNIDGSQLFYAGLVNATHNGMNVTVPLQTFFEHYHTIGGKDAITASSFLGLVSFRENATSIFPNSPDKNDTVYASFSLGYPLQAMGSH